ncbi:MAG: hypothetical protein QOH96_950 [Blastocatellia bacterium]|nr:hypothetical protein [Blastocatellia bacterium]
MPLNFFHFPASRSFLLLSIAFLIPFTVIAVEPVTWTTNTRAELLRGDALGVSISDTGAITLAPKLEQLYNTEQAYIWSSAVDAAGNVYLGTGHDGKIFKVGSDGHGALLYDAPELDVTALAVASDGSLFAGTSPDGKVYRIGVDGKAEAYFDPADKYIWSLAVMKDGSLAVGTGDSGKIYRVKAKDAKPDSSLLADTTETNIISLAVDLQGNLLAGTDPGGIVLRVSPEGKTFALFDSSLREIHSISPAADGSLYVVGLSDAAAGARAPGATAGEGAGGTTAATTTVLSASDDSSTAASQSPPPVKSRADLSNAKSAVFRILPDGGTDVLWNSSTVNAFSVIANPSGNGALVGTSDKGRIYSVSNDGRDTLLLQTTEGQVSVLQVHGSQIYAASSNQGKLARFGAAPFETGTFESAIRDTKLVSSWGRIWGRGQGRIELQTRTGNSSSPDPTWSDWSPAYSDLKGAQIVNPRARFIQWRATLKSGAGGSGVPSLEGVNVAYLPRNVAPEILMMTFLPPGVGLQPAIQVQADPNIEASGLDPNLFGIQTQAPPRKVYQRGAKSLQWQSEDRNGDALEFSLYYRSLNESEFRLLKDKIRDNFYTIDGSTLSDGKYIFKVVASDAPDNPLGQSLSGERLSEPVEIDNTPPEIRQLGATQVSGDSVKVVFDAEDATGLIKKAEISIDGGLWRAVSPDDGIADSPKERYSLNSQISGPGEHTVSFRAFDTSGNAGSTRVTFKK